MALDMNPMAAGYGQAPGMLGMNPLGQQTGKDAPQKATSVPGAIANIVDAIKNGYDQGQARRSEGMPPPIASSTGIGSPPSGLPPAPMAPPGMAMPPEMPGAPPIPFPGAGGLPPETPDPYAGINMSGMPGGMPGGGMGLMDLFGSGQQQDPSNLSMQALFGGMGGGGLA